MDTAQIFTLTVVVIGFGILYFTLRKDRRPTDDNDAYLRLFQNMQERIDRTNEELNKTLRQTQQHFHTTLSSNTNQVTERLDNAAKVIGDVQKNLGEMSEIGRGMRELQEFLQSPKLRGNIGEQVLKELLGQMLPKQSFHLQYTFKSGAIVDAAIKTEAGIIPIDSKFPMENFRKMMASENQKEKTTLMREFERDVKKHIDDVAKKYILTHEGTIDYAVLYVPSEAVYYEIVNNPTLFDYASKKNILPVSPSTFYAYLRSVMMSFEGQRISVKAREVLSSIKAIQREHEKLGDDLSTLSRHITNSHNMMSNVQGDHMRLGQQISSTKNLGVEEEKMVEGKKP